MAGILGRDGLDLRNGQRRGPRTRCDPRHGGHCSRVCNSELHLTACPSPRASGPAASTGCPRRSRATRSGYAVAALSRVARSDLRRPARAAQAGRAGRLHGHPQRLPDDDLGEPDVRAPGQQGPAGGARPARRAEGVFDLTPTEDEQMLVDVVTEFATEVVRPAAAEADETCPAPEAVLKAEPRDRAADPRPPRGARRHLRGALGDGRHPRGRGAREGRPGPGGRRARARLGRHRDRPVGHRRAAADLPAGVHRARGASVPAAALALNEPTVLFDVLTPSTTARRTRRRVRPRRREVRSSRAAPRRTCS